MSQNAFDDFEQAFARRLPAIITWSQALFYAAAIMDTGFKYVSTGCPDCRISPRRALAHIVMHCRTQDADPRFWALKETIPYDCMTQHGYSGEALIGEAMLKLADDVAPVAKQKGWLDIRHHKQLEGNLQPPHSTMVSITSRLVYAELDSMDRPKPSVPRMKSALARGFDEYVAILERYCST